MRKFRTIMTGIFGTSAALCMLIAASVKEGEDNFYTLVAIFACAFVVCSILAIISYNPAAIIKYIVAAGVVVLAWMYKFMRKHCNFARQCYAHVKKRSTYSDAFFELADEFEDCWSENEERKEAIRRRKAICRKKAKIRRLSQDIQDMRECN